MRKLLLLTALALATAACGDVGENVSGSAMGAWELESGRLQGTAIEIVPGFRITLTLEPGQVGGRSGCNSYGGAVAINATSIEFGEISHTLVGCEPPVMAAEQAYLAALLASDSIERAGDGLVLTGPDSVLRFRLLPPVPTAELVGQEWVLESLIEGDVVSSVGGEPATLLLGTDGSLTGSTGCRTLTGTYVLSGDQVNATRLAADGMCSPDLADQDGHVIEVIGDGFTAVIDGDRLQLSSIGEMGLVYRAG